jgi:hypothetical protein
MILGCTVRLRGLVLSNVIIANYILFHPGNVSASSKAFSGRQANRFGREQNLSG